MELQGLAASRGGSSLSPLGVLQARVDDKGAISVYSRIAD